MSTPSCASTRTPSTYSAEQKEVAAMTWIATQPTRIAEPRLRALRAWPARRWSLAGLVVVAGAVVLGVPTGVIPTPFYTRMTPVLWWNYPVLAASAILLGLTAATYLRRLIPEGERSAKVATGGGLLSLFAIGCPVCNKLVVLAIGAAARCDGSPRSSRSWPPSRWACSVRRSGPASVPRSPARPFPRPRRLIPRGQEWS